MSSASHDSDPKGWRIAGLTVLLAVALTAGAWAIHKKTFCDPRHPACAAAAAATHAAAEDHGAAPHAAEGDHAATDAAKAHADSGHAPATVPDTVHGKSGL